MPSGHHDAEELSQLLGAGAEPEPLRASVWQGTSLRSVPRQTEKPFL
jgi:hypothetical protein